MDEGEDPSVTAAIVNVVCELGWRRPHDFLPLAPRLFELLVDSGNNWMAIKLIKLVRILSMDIQYLLIVLVCYFDSPGTTAGQEVVTPFDLHHPNDSCHVAIV